MKNAELISLALTRSARQTGLDYATAHGLTLGAWSHFTSLDKQVIAFHFMKDGKSFDPTRSDGRFAYAQMPRLILRADGTVFRDLLFNPFA
jgi:hypothetical protein